MLLELAGDGAVDRPMAGVVGAHRELVDEDALAGPLHDDEHLDGEDAGDAEFGGDALAEGAGGLAGLLADPDRRRGDDGADPVDLLGRGDRPGGDLPAGAAGAQGGDLETKGTSSSARRGPFPNQSATSAGSFTTRTPCPS